MSIETTDRPTRHRLLAALLGCSSLLALGPTVLLAQEPADGVVLDTIVLRSEATNDANTIVATRTTAGTKMATDILDTAASVSVITSKEIEARGAQNVEQVLQYTAGVTTDHYGSDDRFDFFKIRGFDAYTYRDGLRLGSPFGAVREEVFAFERVEVLKGANSTSFGLSDPGGSVNYVSKRARPERFGEVHVTGGSNNRAELGFDLGDRLTPDGTLSYRLTGKLRDADAEYKYSRDDEKFLMGGLSWRPTDATTLDLVVDYLKFDGVPGSGGHPVGSGFGTDVFLGEPDYNFRGVERTNISLSLDHDFGGGLSFGSNLRYTVGTSDFGYAYIAATPPTGTVVNRAFFGNESSGETFIAEARLRYDTRLGETDSSTLAGVEYRRSTGDNAAFYGAAPDIDWTNPVYSGAPASVPLFRSSRTNETTKAAYLQQNLTWGKFVASAGLRHDWMDIKQTNKLAGTVAEGDVSETTFRAGLTYKITEEISAYAAYAESAVPSSGLTVEPERGEQIELGVKYMPAGSSTLLSAAIYDLTKNNITRNDPVTMEPRTIGEVRVRGIDLEARTELANNISAIAAYSYLDHEIVENGASGNEGNRMAFVPRHLASLWLNYTLKGDGARGDMTFGLGGRYTGSYYFDDANSVDTGSNFVVDAAYSYQLRENTELAVNVTNLFDRQHVAYGGFGADFNNPGRAVSATLRHRW